ncbi:hypothetical protein H0H93_002106 [Arthromyces matolae]|nr:hypothetical protein H0H93_002106 [Arthromyces matolae]
MASAGRLILAAALCPLAFAFSDTAPFIAWSSYPSSLLQQLSSSTTHSQALLESIISSEEVCGLDAVILVGHEGLHASDLRILSPSSPFVRLLSGYSSQRQFEYVRPLESADVEDAVEAVTDYCGFNAPVDILITPGDAAVPGYFSHDSKNVVNIKLESLEGLIGGMRIDRVSLQASQLANELEYLSSTYPKHLVVYTGTSPAANAGFSIQQLAARQQPNSLSSPGLEALSRRAGNTTLAHGGILKRYQLLTPGLITSLLVAFFILLPIVSFGFRALASIQSPIETEAPNKFSADEKKRQ